MIEALTHIGLLHYLFVSAAIFGAGIATVLIRRNAIGVLLGIELIINAAAINFVAGAAYLPAPVSGHAAPGAIFAVFVIVTAAAEAAVALAIIMNFYNSAGSIDLTRADQLNG